MRNRLIKSLDPILTVGVVVSITLAILLVLIGQDKVISLLIGLSITIISLLIDIIARLKHSEVQILQATELGNLLARDETIHHILWQIAHSYYTLQQSDFDLFVEKSKDILYECKDTLKGMESGYLIVEPGGKYSYGRRGVRRAKHTIKAVAYEDIESWRTTHLRDVLKVNKEAIEAGITIERIFILNKQSLEEAQDVLQAHHAAGVKVYLAFPEDLPSTQLLESYQVIDDEILVIFYYTRDGKQFREEKV